MRRIAALIAVFLAAGVASRAVMAQRLPGVPHIGVLAPLSPEQSWESVDAFRTGMRALGWIDGGNVLIEVRFANGDPASLSGLQLLLLRKRSMSSSPSAGIPPRRPTGPLRRSRS